MFFSKKKPLPSCPNILTPDQIPSFFIPPKLSPSPDGGRHLGKWFQKRSLEAGPRSTARALQRSASRHVIQVEDVEQETGSPRLRHGSNMAADIMGGPYLSESPHTRRRESLFHQMCPTHGPSQPKPLCPSESPFHQMCPTHGPSQPKPPCPSQSPFHQMCPTHGPSQPKPRCPSQSRVPQDLRFLVPDSDTGSSTESSPFSSPLLNRPFQVGQTSAKPPAFSRALTARTLTRASSLSTEETSSTDTSPNLPTKEDHFPMVRLIPPPILHLDFICCQDRLTKETEVALGKGGLARLSAEYAKGLGRLRVKIVNVEDVYPSHQDPKTIGCCVAVSLVPGNLQKQKSTVIRRSRNPIFNEDFYFEGLEEGDLDRLRLKVKVVNRGGGMRRDVLLGRNEIQLSAILPR